MQKTVQVLESWGLLVFFPPHTASSFDKLINKTMKYVMCSSTDVLFILTPG